MRVETGMGSGVVSDRRTPSGDWQWMSDRDPQHLPPSHGSPGEGSEVSGHRERHTSPGPAGPLAYCWDGHACTAPLKGGRGSGVHTP